MSNHVMVMWFLWRPLWPASHHLKRNENFQRKTKSGTQVPLGLVGGEVVALGLPASGHSPSPAASAEWTADSVCLWMLLLVCV